MPALALEWLNLALRWAHVIAAIMWIGDSFLFVWLDRTLSAPRAPRAGDVLGEIWLVHGGGFYELVKRRSLAADELPERLYWFKWQAYTTWITGFLLLAVVFLLGSSVALVEPGAHAMGRAAAAGLSLALLVAGWLVYDALWSSPLGRNPRAAALVSFALLALAAFGLCRVYTGRAAYLQLGAMLGTIMAANVAHRIIPAQRQMLAATRAAQPVDVSLGARAKSRSLHNHYLTLPVLFTMLSAHFPSTYGHPLAWLVLLLIFIAAAAVKHVMNEGLRSDRRVLAIGALALAAAITMTVQPPTASREAAALAAGPPVRFEEARAIVECRCVSCHAAHPANPAFPEPPNGVTFETPVQIRSRADRILVRAVLTKTMPLGNLTGMTDDERRTLGAWIAQGAPIDSAH
jgi:uncharacterized membrane protein